MLSWSAAQAMCLLNAEYSSSLCKWFLTFAMCRMGYNNLQTLIICLLSHGSLRMDDALWLYDQGRRSYWERETDMSCPPCSSLEVWKFEVGNYFSPSLLQYTGALCRPNKWNALISSMNSSGTRIRRTVNCKTTLLGGAESIKQKRWTQHVYSVVFVYTRYPLLQ